MAADTAPLAVRRIVMGESAEGRSVFTHVDEVPALAPSEEFLQYYIWGWDKTPTLPYRGASPYVETSHFPPVGGVRVTANLFGGDVASSQSYSGGGRQDAAEFDRLLQAVQVNRVVGSPAGMHRTDTVDIGVVIAGEVTVEAEDGSAVVMRAGDVYIQNGASHLWRTNPENPALVVVIIFGTRRDS
jgi:hypothetical protein